jgi:hypothetical protein
VIAEGNETPQGPRGEPPVGPQGPEGRGRRGEGDPLAERRARRAAEAPEHLLTLRAEAAEATVRTLESHLATVQQRLHDAEAETRRLQEELVAEASSRERGGETSARTGILERELQRAQRREQAEHRARVEAEDREREERAEIDRLARRLDANERYVRALAAQLQELERRLARAEESAQLREAAEREELHARVAEVERSAVEIGHGLERERAERERAERVLASIRRGQRRVEGIVRELGTIVSRLRAQVSSAPPPPPATPAALPGASELAARSASMRRAPSAPTSTPGAPAPAPAPAPTSEGRPPVARELAPHDRSGELESALAAAVERLRARAEDGAAQPPAPLEAVSRAAVATAPMGPGARVGETEPPAAVADTKTVRRLPTQPTPEPPAPRRAAAAAPPAGPAGEPAAAATTTRAPSHKHSLSLIDRLRRARKQRREHR